MSKVDETVVKALRTDINAVLAPLASKKGLTLKLGHCTFDRANGNFTFKLDGTVKGGLTKEEASYETLRSLRPKLPPLRSTFVLDDRTFQIAGANSTRSKVIARMKGKEYNVPISVVEQAATAAKKD